MQSASLDQEINIAQFNIKERKYGRPLTSLQKKKIQHTLQHDRLSKYGVSASNFG
jgi:hypothetical protein